MTTLSIQAAAARPAPGLADHVLRSVLALVFAAAAGMKLAATEFEVQGFAHFGYAPWFMYAIGLVELAGALALLSRRAAAPAALLLMAVMVGAIASHLRAGDPVPMAAPAAVLLILLGAVAWRHRGVSRTA